MKAIKTIGMVLAGMLTTGLFAQDDAVRPADEGQALEIAAKATDGGVRVQVTGGYRDGITVVLFGHEQAEFMRLPNGLMLEIAPFGVFGWARTDLAGDVELEVNYKPEYASGLKFRLQAFAVALGQDEDGAEQPMRASSGLLVKLP